MKQSAFNEHDVSKRLGLELLQIPFAQSSAFNDAKRKHPLRLLVRLGAGLAAQRTASLIVRPLQDVELSRIKHE
jgi:hypothetical protein